MKIKVWPTNNADHREGKDRDRHKRDRSRQAGDGRTQQTGGDQEQFEIDEEPCDLGGLVSQREQECTGRGEPGGIVVGKEVIFAQPVF